MDLYGKYGLYKKHGKYTRYGFLVASGCLLSRKVWWDVQISSFCQKLRYFTDQNGQKAGPYENEFWLLSIAKMNVTIEHKR